MESRNTKMAAILAAFPKTKRPSRDRPGYTSISFNAQCCTVLDSTLLLDDSARHKTTAGLAEKFAAIEFCQRNYLTAAPVGSILS
jgi:hypothetical protein